MNNVFRSVMFLMFSTYLSVVSAAQDPLENSADQEDSQTLQQQLQVLLAQEQSSSDGSTELQLPFANQDLPADQSVQQLPPMVPEQAGSAPLTVDPRMEELLAVQQLQSQQLIDQQQANSGMDTAQVPLLHVPQGAIEANSELVAQQQIEQQLQETDPQDIIDEAAFRAALGNAFPLTPEQVLRLREMYEAIQFADSSSPGTPPRPTTASQFVGLDPGATPVVIRLAQGFVSSLVFLDSTGAPWEVTAYDLGNPEAFNVQWDRISNTLMVQANELYTYGNLAVRLKGLTTPVMLTLMPGQQAVDYRVDLRVQGLGPNAVPLPTGHGLPESVDPILLSILDGVPPPGGRELMVSGGEAQVWEQENKLFLRTRLTVLSPAWLSTMSSADGMRVYEMHKTPVLLVSNQGRVVQLKIEGL